MKGQIDKQGWKDRQVNMDRQTNKYMNNQIDTNRWKDRQVNMDC